MSTYAYDANNWVTNLDHTLGLSLVAGFAYDYDHEGNRKFEHKRHLPSDSEAYVYDALDRLTSFAVGTLSGSTIPSPSFTRAWTLDVVGNWTRVLSNSVAEARTHNAVNEILTIGGHPLSYDAQGSLTNDTRYRYTYDAANRLSSVIRKSDSAIVGQYFYDAFGRRIAKIANPAGSPTTTLYLYDGMRVIEEQNAGMVLQSAYVYGAYVDDILTMERAGQTYYYHPNALATVELLTDAFGAVVERYSYDAYGLVSVSTGGGVLVPSNPWGTLHSAVGNPYEFTGREVDEETGLYCYRARYYDCVKGRFLTRDPLLDGVHDPVLLLSELLFNGDDYADPESGISDYSLNNLYDYVSDNPVNFVDPSGLEPKPKHGHAHPKPNHSHSTPHPGPNPAPHPRPAPVRPAPGAGAAPAPAAPPAFVPLPNRATKAGGEAALKKGTDGLKALCDDCCGACDKPCTVDKCKDEAQKMMDAVIKSWNENYGNGANRSGDNVGGYLCWDWSRAFERAAKSVRPACWDVKQGMVNKKNSTAVHFFVVFNACKNPAEKCTGILEDGWVNKDEFFHKAPWPPAAEFTPGNWWPTPDMYTRPAIK